MRRAPRTADASSSRPNDLRHYLQHMASAPHEAGHDARPDAGAHPTKMEKGKVGAVLKSLNAVLNHILAAGKGEAPAALLVAPATEKVDATSEAIEIARALVAKRLRVVLVDLTRGAAAVSGRLGIPRVPGFNDLAAGRVSFEEVLAVDEETPLQVIAAGNPKVTANGDEGARFARVFSALTQAYDCVVLHADRETALKLKPELRFELPVLVVVLPAGASAEREHESLAELAGFGCPVVAYEQSGKEPRSGLFGRVAAV
jgi:Mrp family chromosome partitioning ATPase